MNIKAISRNVGYALLVSALFMLFSILVSASRGNDSAMAALIISFTLTFTVGIFPFIFIRHAPGITLKDGYMIIFLSWILSFIFGMLPYLLWGGPFTVVNAFFESVSGFTTTGATTLTDIESLPDSLLFWRSSTNFIGGLGVVVFLLLIIPDSSPVRLRLANMELSSLSRQGYKARTNKTVIIFTSVYLALAVVAFFAYWLAGMTPFDAINHAFSICSMGGFSTRNSSIGSFNSDAISIITMVLMLLASIHFGIVFMVFATRSLKPLNNPVLKFYLGSLSIGCVISVLCMKFGGIYASWHDALIHGTFQVISYGSTTGLSNADNSSWPMFLGLMMMYLSIPGGMSGSTSGGVKSDRMLLLFKTIKRQVHNTIHPSKISEIKFSNRSVSDEDVKTHVLYLAVFFVMLFLSVILAVAGGSSFNNSLCASISSLCNLGPSLGELGTAGNFSAEPTFSKLVYCCDMFLGRIEIYPVLAVFGMMFTRKRN